MDNAFLARKSRLDIGQNVILRGSEHYRMEDKVDRFTNHAPDVSTNALVWLAWWVIIPSSMLLVTTAPKMRPGSGGVKRTTFSLPYVRHHRDVVNGADEYMPLWLSMRRPRCLSSMQLKFTAIPWRLRSGCRSLARWHCWNIDEFFISRGFEYCRASLNWRR